ncbi:flagellar biosynthesis anti-sigma factor FlgM [Fundidesulfovibrio terrae]|uniref:flagellar biosynthesis anti-sigma factor FlgM n=1 Tax=Fundidesulfovibrio terrae TaxID=2922866 RepID=UPI001FAF6D66|nr:flagellar biosynthesis anti-sigma factor FlgM [Fundidesulfovibrio terrae]
MDREIKHPDGKRTDPSSESPEERAKRVADIKRRVAQGSYNVDSREILYNMIKTAP